jgi:hypothetical protein
MSAVANTWTDIPDAEKKIGLREKNVPWYNKSIDKNLGPSARELFENYSKIPSAEVEAHVLKIVCFASSSQGELPAYQDS